jgi:hypothetical protein
MSEREMAERRTPLRQWLVAVAIAAMLNVCFMALLAASSLVPKDHLRARVTEAFADGSLIFANRTYNTKAGFQQYNDCVVLQMVMNDDTIAGWIFGPIWYHKPGFSDMCAVTRDLAARTDVPPDLIAGRYARYWHGHNVVAAIIVGAVPLRVARSVFRWVAYLAALTLLVVSLRLSGPLNIVGTAVGIVGLLFWGLPYFAPSPAHGPADAVLMSGLAGILFAGRRLQERGLLVACCAALGALLTFMEYLSGILPVAAGILVPVLYFTGDAGKRGWWTATQGIAALGAGVVITTAIKQSLSLAVLGPSVMNAFSGNLAYYTGNPFESNRLVSVARIIFDKVHDWGALLTYGSRPGMAVLFGSALVAWAGAAVLAMRLRTVASLNALLACAGGAVAIAAWVFLLPVHTNNHPMMVRIFMVPIALGWAALIIQLQHARGTRGG